MQLARVVGKAVSTTKHISMQGQRLLIVQPMGANGQADGNPVLAIDTLGAGIGATAIISSDGKAARKLLGNDQSPVRYTCIGLEDDK